MSRRSAARAPRRGEASAPSPSPSRMRFRRRAQPIPPLASRTRLGDRRREGVHHERGAPLTTFHIVAAATEPAGGPRHLDDRSPSRHARVVEPRPIASSAGMRATPTSSRSKVPRPEDNLLGERGRGFRNAGGPRGCAHLVAASPSDSRRPASTRAWRTPRSARRSAGHRFEPERCSSRSPTSEEVETARLATYRAAWLKDQRSRTRRGRLAREARLPARGPSTVRATPSRSTAEQVSSKRYPWRFLP